eukprot:1425082-Rhodomonas_salina.1
MSSNKTMISWHFLSGMDSRWVRVSNCMPRSSITRAGPSRFSTFSITPPSLNTSAATLIISSIHGSSTVLFA